MCPLLNNKITKQRTIRTFRQANISLVALIVSTFNKTENNEKTFRQEIFLALLLVLAKSQLGYFYDKRGSDKENVEVMFLVETEGIIMVI